MEQVFDFTAGADGRHADSSPELRRLHDLAAWFQQYVGHELVNQLVPIQAYARLLQTQSDDGLDAETRELLGRLADLTGKADRLARQVADVGRLLREPAWGLPLGLAEIVDEAITELRVRRQLAEVKVNVAVQDVAVVQSRSLLHAVLTQLLHNAGQAADPGRDLRIEVHGGPQADGVKIVVRDTGRGIAEAQVKLLIEPFAAGRAAPASHLGLGFFLVRQAVARWRGRIGVCSSVGTGTTVELYLPRWSGEARSEGVASAVPVAPCLPRISS